MSPDESTNPDAASRRRSRLADPRSVIGAIAVVATVAAFVFLIPFVEENTDQSGGLDEAGRFIVDDYTTMVLPDGWRIDNQSEFFKVLTDGTYQMILSYSAEDTSTPEESLEPFHSTYAEDPANTVTDISLFATTDGAMAAGYRAVLASDPTGSGSYFAAVSQNGRLFSPAITGPTDLADPFYDEFTEMVRSVIITAEPREGSS